MAKRKRLTPAQAGYLEDRPASSAPRAAASAFAAAPIAQVAGDSAANAALEEVAGALQAARDEGRLVELLPLDAIDQNYLVRDRIEQDADEMGALMDSLRARGQQTPIEVIRLPEPRGKMTHGLISGWRRLTALRRLYSNGSEPDFAFVRALVVQPASAQDAYVAMVEENEIRVNLSHYERARIALKAVQQNVYPTPRAALQGLYGNATRSKRSKIGSFMHLVEELDPVLRFPTAISEKLGLALVRELVRDPALAGRIRSQLTARPCETQADELRVLAAAAAPRGQGGQAAEKSKTGSVKGEKAASASPAPLPVKVAPGVALMFDAAKPRIELTGPSVDETLVEDLKVWLAARGQP